MVVGQYPRTRIGPDLLKEGQRRPLAARRIAGAPVVVWAPRFHDDGLDAPARRTLHHAPDDPGVGTEAGGPPVGDSRRGSDRHRSADCVTEGRAGPSEDSSGNIRQVRYHPLTLRTPATRLPIR